jgi:NAD(P)-dependent dehydrogenase (short-subunit alcohol dehydrogenase family)
MHRILERRIKHPEAAVRLPPTNPLHAWIAAFILPASLAHGVVMALPQGTALPSLTGKHVLVAGGAGQIGFPIVAACLASGATVVVPSRSQARLDALRGKLSDSVASRLVPLVGSIGEVPGAEALRDEIARRVGTLHGVVASLGGWFTGKALTELDIADWNRVLHDNLTTHFVAARTFIPVLQASGKGGAYIFLSGPAGEVPRPMSGAVSVAVAGEKMLVRVLAEEVAGTGVRVQELVYATMKHEPHWLPLDALLREIVRSLAK